MSAEPGVVVPHWVEGSSLASAEGGPMSLELPVEDQSRVGEARRAAVTIAQDAGLDQEDAGRVALVVTELATNLARHGGGGVLLLRAWEERGDQVVEVLAADRGPGIGDIGRALADGFSTGGTLGAGMGGIRRAADDFDIHSGAGQGTVVLARVRSRRASTIARIGVVCRSHPGEQQCGDGWLVRDTDARLVTVVVDGLGHGMAAAAAAQSAREAAGRLLDHDPSAGAARIMEVLHEALRPTRGAAGAAAVLDRGTGTMEFAGVGNIAGVLLGPGDQRSLVSHNGILGHQVRKVQAFPYQWPAGGVLVMHSDGLGTRWRIEQYPGVLGRDPSLLAALLYRDHVRGRDDATVLVARATAA